MISAWRTLPFEGALILIEAVLYLNATSNLALAYPLKQKRQPFLPPTAPFHVITNSSTFKLTIRHDSEWLTGWTFVNKVKLLKTIFVGRVQHMKILLLTKILIFRYQNVLWITTEYNWVFYSRLKRLSEPTPLEILKPFWDVQKSPTDVLMSKRKCYLMGSVNFCVNLWTLNPIKFVDGGTLCIPETVSSTQVVV